MGGQAQQIVAGLELDVAVVVVVVVGVGVVRVTVLLMIVVFDLPVTGVLMIDALVEALKKLYILS